MKDYMIWTNEEKRDVLSEKSTIVDTMQRALLRHRLFAYPMQI